MKQCDVRIEARYSSYTGLRSRLVELVRNAPKLHTIGISIFSIDYYFNSYLNLISRATELESLRHMTITFELSGDSTRQEAIIEAARQSLRGAPATGNKILEVRWERVRKSEDGYYSVPDGMSDEYRVQRETLRKS